MHISIHPFFFVHMRRVVFRVIICSVDLPFFPYDIELVLGFPALYPIGSLLTRPSAVELSVTTGVLDCGCPISSKAIRRGMAALQL